MIRTLKSCSAAVKTYNIRGLNELQLLSEFVAVLVILELVGDNHDCSSAVDVPNQRTTVAARRKWLFRLHGHH